MKSLGKTPTQTGVESEQQPLGEASALFLWCFYDVSQALLHQAIYRNI